MNKIRHLWDLNPCSQREIDFESIALTTRPKCPIESIKYLKMYWFTPCLNLVIQHMLLKKQAKKALMRTERRNSRQKNSQRTSSVKFGSNFTNFKSRNKINENILTFKQSNKQSKIIRVYHLCNWHQKIISQQIFSLDTARKQARKKNWSI